MDSRVFAVRCESYDAAAEAVAELLEAMGGIGRFAAAGERIVLKPNLLRAASPHDAVTTHPAVVAAVGRAVVVGGAQAVLADSPGAGYRYTEAALRRTYDRCGMTAAAQQAGFALNFDTSHEIVSHPEGRLIKRFEVITPVVRADGLINLCKLKTHEFTGMTGAVKNLFGVVPGLIKPGYHGKLADSGRFAAMTLDLAGLIAPRLSIMDAVVGMEGEGPGSGDPRAVGWLLGSESPLALDVIAGEIMGLPPADNPLLVEAQARGAQPWSPEQIDLVGATLEELRVPDFRLPATRLSGVGVQGAAWWQKPLAALLTSGFSVRPEVIADECIACGACVRACPVHVIELVGGRGSGHAKIDRRGCIRCYCCHEMCPVDAIALRRSLLHRLVNR